MDSLKDKWLVLVSSFNDDTGLAENLYLELEQKYSEKHRYYHTLEHISALLRLVEEYKAKITNLPFVLFSLWYHDVIYNTLKKNNEEKSAEFAKKRLEKIGVDQSLIKLVHKLIIATKTHVITDEINNFDGEFFLDCDLSILGSDRQTYLNYVNQIRKEYKIYPDLIYKQGRIKVLNHFLNKNKIYNTTEMQERFEIQARNNLKYELESL